MSYVALLIIFWQYSRPFGQLDKDIPIEQVPQEQKITGISCVTTCSRVVATGNGTREDKTDDYGREQERAILSFHSPMTLIVLLLGLAVGVLVGLLGIGGGVALVPALVYLLHMDQHLAQGTSLFILLPPVGLGALRGYWKQGQVDLRAGILCAMGMLAGGYFGGLIAVPLASRNLKGLFGCFLILAAFLLWRKPQAEKRTMASASEESVHE
jgi:hypothetical protein